MDRDQPFGAGARIVPEHAQLWAVNAIERPSWVVLALPDHDVQEELGHGQVSATYAARHLPSQERRIVKWVRHELWAEPAALGVLLRENHVLGQLRHPDIPVPMTIGTYGSQPFFCRDFLEGTSLAERLRTGGPLPPGMAARIVAQAARAVHEAHRKGLNHRDLKPSNLFLTPDGGVKVLDYGIGTQTMACLTGARTPFGPLGCRPPEQAVGPGLYGTPAVDVYALGAILYEASTGRPPFADDARQPTAAVIRVLATLPTEPRRLRPEIPPELEFVILKCLEKDPDRRYPTARRLAEDLEAADRRAAAAGSRGRYLRSFVCRAERTASLDWAAGTSVAWGSLVPAVAQTIGTYVGGVLAADAWFARTVPPEPAQFVKGYVALAALTVFGCGMLLTPRVPASTHALTRWAIGVHQVQSAIGAAAILIAAAASWANFVAPWTHDRRPPGPAGPMLLTLIACVALHFAVGWWKARRAWQRNGDLFEPREPVPDPVAITPPVEPDPNLN